MNPAMPFRFKLKNGKNWNRAEIAALIVLIALWVLLIAVALSGSGCGTFAALKHPFVTTTNVVEQVRVLPAQTNTTTVVLTNTTPAGPVLVTNVLVQVQPAVTLTNYVTNVVTTVAPALTGAIETVRTVNTAVNPTPTAPFVNMALLAVSGVLGWVARLKTVKAARALQDATAKNELLETVIAGVEAAKNDDVKAKISEMAQLWKTHQALDAKVQELTRKT